MVLGGALLQSLAPLFIYEESYNFVFRLSLCSFCISASFV